MENQSLIHLTKDHWLIASLLRNNRAIWILGYITIYGPVTEDEIIGSIESDGVTLSELLGQLANTGLIKTTDSGEFEPSDKGIRISKLFGIDKDDDTDYARKAISCDVYQIENVDYNNSSKDSKEKLIRHFTEHHPFAGEVEGHHYGFAESRVVGEDVVYGYFSQEYWDKSLKYDNSIERYEEWDARFSPLLFIWPVKSSFFILQDTRFYGAPALNMTKTKDRIIMLMTSLLNYYDIKKTGDIVFRSSERTLSREEMLSVLVKSETVTKAQIGMESATTSVEKLPVFNPREDWNEVLRQIINEYEVPNLGNVVFTAKRFGTLSKSKFAKALALIGEIKNIKLGRGKNARTVTPKVPIHVGKAVVSDPITEEEVLGILGSLQEKLNTRLTDVPIKVNSIDLQIQFDI